MKNITRILKEDISKIKNVWGLGMIFATFLVLGYNINTYHTVQYNNITIYLSIILISFVIDILLVQFYKLIEKYEKKKSKEIKLTTWQKALIIFFILIICWMPVLLAAYPGYFCYDAHDELQMYEDNQLIDWMPPLHVFVMGSIIEGVQSVTNSYNIGILAYTCFQMVIISLCFTYCIMFLDKYKVTNGIKIFSIIYYALFPVISMYAICSTKDTIFSAVVLVSIIVALDALLNKEKFLNSIGEQVKFGLVVFLAIILRKNAIYAYIPFLLLFAIAFKNKKVWINVFAILWSYFVIYTILIYGIFHVSRMANAEAWSVPLQQIARVYNYNYDSLDEDELQEIYKYTDDEQLKSYIPECSDPVKTVNLREIGYIDFVKLWAKIGVKNIGIYIDSFLENTLGFWYPHAIIDGYNEKEPKLYREETSYFEAICETPGYEDSKIPYLRDVLYNISRYEAVHKIPVISLFFSVRSNGMAYANMYWIQHL